MVPAASAGYVPTLDNQRWWSVIQIRHRTTGEVLFEAEGESLVGARLAGLVLPYGDLAGMDLSGADLRGADLGSANMSGAYFRRANLSGADLSGGDLTDAVLDGAKLIDARLIGVNLTGTSLRDADLSRVSAKLSYAIERGPDFRGALLVRAFLAHTALPDASFAGADLTGATLSHSTLINADLTGAMLATVTLSGTNLSGASLRQADLSWAILYGTRLTGADFSSTILGRTVFAACPTLSAAIGLAEANHADRSAVDLETLMTAGELPEEFLDGIGVGPGLVGRLAPLFAGRG